MAPIFGQDAGWKQSATVLAALALGGCAAGTSPLDGARAGERQCSVQLAPRTRATARPAAPETATPTSLLVVHAETSLSPLKEKLEARVPRRLSEGRVRIGPGGTVSYSVERGALSLRVSRTALSIETPVRARAEACRGDDCYASCEPEAQVIAEVPLLLQPDYRFQRTSVSIRFTRACKVRTLGGLLTLDITPTLEAHLRPELERVAAEVDAQLPQLEGRIAEAWTELSLRRELPLGGCFVLQPYGVVQGPFVPSRETLGASFAVRARPELRAHCEAGAPSSPAAPLPPLQSDPSLPEEGVLTLGMVRPLDSLARAFESSPALPISGKSARIARAQISSRGSEVDLQLSLRGEVCGDVALAAALDFSGDGQLIRLAQAELGAGERERLLGSDLDEAQLLRELAGVPKVAPLLSVSALGQAAPSLAAGLSRPKLTVRATLSSTRPAGAVARGQELLAWLEARGALWLKLEE